MSLGAEATLAAEVSDEWRMAALGYAPDGVSMSRGMRKTDTTLTVEALLVSGADDTILPGGEVMIGHSTMDTGYKTSGIFKPSVDVVTDAPDVLGQMLAQTEKGAALRGVIPVFGGEGTVGARKGEMEVPLDAWYVIRDGEQSGWEHCMTHIEMQVKYSNSGGSSVKGDTSEEHFTQMSAQGWRLHAILPTPVSARVQASIPTPMHFFWSRPIENPPVLDCFIGDLQVRTKSSMSGKVTSSTSEFREPIANLVTQGWIMGSLIGWPGHSIKGATVIQSYKAFFQRVQ